MSAAYSTINKMNLLPKTQSFCRDLLDMLKWDFLQPELSLKGAFAG